MPRTHALSEAAFNYSVQLKEQCEHSHLSRIEHSQLEVSLCSSLRSGDTVTFVHDEGFISSFTSGAQNHHQTQDSRLEQLFQCDGLHRLPADRINTRLHCTAVYILYTLFQSGVRFGHQA